MRERYIRPGVSRLFRIATSTRSRIDRDIDDEIAFHIEERAQQLLIRGYDAASARLEAERRFGDVAAARKALRKTATRRDQQIAFRQRVVDSAQDVRFALRSLRRAPGFVTIAVTCLALGIGANAAIFSVIDALLLKPLPYANPTQLVRVWPEAALPPGAFDILERDSRAFSRLGGVEAGRPVSVTGHGEPVRLVAAQATDGFFDVLGVPPVLGRTFLDGENALSAPLVAVISHALWQSRFGGDRRVLGKMLSVDGLPREIVGVMPAHFAFPSNQVHVWTPAKFIPGSSSYWWTTYLTVIGRLAPHSTLTSAKAEMPPIFDRARAAFPMRMPDDWGKAVDVVSLRDSIVVASRNTMLMLFGAVGLVLLMACVNVASLYMGRAAVRAREMSVRAALGAARSRLVRLLLVESVLVAALGTATGLLLALIGTRVLVASLPPGTPRVDEIGIDLRVVLFSALLMLASAIGFGLVPALRATRRSSMSLRHDERTGASRSSVRVGVILAAAQVALAVTLVSGAGLLLKSFWELRQVDPGFRTTNIYTAEIPIPAFARDSATRTPLFYQQVVEQLRATPGVLSATAASSVPFGDGSQSAAMEVEAHPTPPGAEPALPQLTAVGDDYFNLLGISLVQGRLLSSSDRVGTLQVGVIDQEAARRLWPTENAIGQRIRYVWNRDWITIVGIVSNVRRDSMSSTSQPSLYVPLAQSFARRMRVLVATDGDARAATQLIRSAVAKVDGNVPVSGVQSLDELVAGSASRTRFAALLLLLFAGVALLLGAVGIHGVLSASVARRTREFGVRMALGATSGQVLRMVLAQSARITATGVAIGIVGVYWTGNALRGMLFGVTTMDGGVLLAVVVVLAVVSVTAAARPARRATKVDPIEAIKAE